MGQHLSLLNRAQCVIGGKQNQPDLPKKRVMRLELTTFSLGS